MYILPSPIYFPYVWLLFAMLRGFVKLFMYKPLNLIVWEKRLFFPIWKINWKKSKIEKQKMIVVDHPGWGPRRKQVCPDRRWTHEGGVVRSKLHSLETSKNARKSEYERTKVCRTHESLDMSAQKSENERTKVWWTHESLNMNARKSGERTKVVSLTWTHKNSCVHVQTKTLTFYAWRCPLKMKTPGFHESTNPHINSYFTWGTWTPLY